MSLGKYSLKKKEKVLQALNDLDFTISSNERDKYVDAFISELKKGLKGKKSSLQVLPSFVKFASKVINQEKIAVLTAGKVTLSKGNFQSTDEKCNVYGVMGYPMPGMSKEITSEEYFRRIILEARDVLRTCEKIGFCFRHPIEANPKGDGKLLEWARGGIKVTGILGKFIGAEFKKYLKEEFDKDYEIIILNDTVATLIAGLAEACDKEFEDFIGLVHSSGYNLSYIEEVENLKAIITDKKHLKGQMVLNTQAGSFAKVKESKIDKEVTGLLGEMKMGEFSQKVNSDCLPLILKVLARELADKILNPKISKKLEEMEDLDLEQIYSFLRVGLKSSLEIASIFRFATLQDAAHLGIIIDQIIQRAARLVAFQLCALLKYKDIGHNPIQPVGILIEGDFFDMVKDFEYRVRHEIELYFRDEDPRFIQFLRLSNAPLLGAGIAAAINL